MLKALSPITFEFFYRCFVWTAPESAWKEHLIKIPMISKETWQTICYGISIERTVKFTKSGFSVKAPLLFKLHIRWSGIFVNLKEQFDNMSYILSLLKLQLSNLNATVTHQKCTIISNCDFDPLHVELGPWIRTKQSQGTIIMCAIDGSLIGIKQFLYAIHQDSEKRIYIRCKVTFSFKYI